MKSHLSNMRFHRKSSSYTTLCNSYFLLLLSHIWYVLHHGLVYCPNKYFQTKYIWWLISCDFDEYHVTKYPRISNLFKFVVLKDPKCSYKECVCEISLVHVILQTLKFVYLSFPKGNKVWHVRFNTTQKKNETCIR